MSIYEAGDSGTPAVLVYNAAISGWTHITVAVSSKQTAETYINGTFVRTGLTSRQAKVHSDPDYIGGGYYGYYGGYLDDVRVYNRALGDTDIQTVAGSGTPGSLSCTPASPPNPTTAAFTVHAGQRPSVTNLSASPSAIDAGQTSTLVWNNAEISQPPESSAAAGMLTPTRYRPRKARSLCDHPQLLTIPSSSPTTIAPPNRQTKLQP